MPHLRRYWLQHGCISRARVALFCLAICHAQQSVNAAAPVTLESPDRRLNVQIDVPGPGSVDLPHWALRFRGKTILSSCRLSLKTKGAGELFTGAQIANQQSRSVDERIPIPFGKADHAANRFRETRLLLKNPQHGDVVLVFRCYDDAVAFRYEIPRHDSDEPVTVTDELSSFALSGNPRAYAQYLENFRTSHEHNVTVTPLRDVKAETLLDLPLTIAYDNGTTLAITEAALRHYAGMSLMRPSADRTELVCRLSPRPDGTKVVRELPIESPWRVVLIGDRAGVLLESNVIYCLNDPCVLSDTAWIKPGKMTWSWWNGNLYDGKPGDPILSVPMARKYIDFCARNGIAYHSVIADETDTPWYRQAHKGTTSGPDSDATKPRADLDLESIRRYADSKGVGLWTWVHQATLRGRVKEAFAAYEKLGWKGMMVDFLDHDDQDTVEFAEEVLQAAARHHILIHFHGIWKATGCQRTYPNLMNHEGALNLEYLKWSDRCTPEHNLLMAFTRLVAGPMDYHLGGFRAVTPAEFKAKYIAPNVLGTRCHHLAMYVCFDNPNPMVADYPAAYEGQPGFDFLVEVPTWWDETRVLVADIGKVLVTARRRGRTWYVGGMTAKAAQSLKIPLSFLGSGSYTAKVWKDTSASEANPNRLETESRPVASNISLEAHLAAGGGFVARFSPVSEDKR
jgi:alpha-glucosidase